MYVILVPHNLRFWGSVIQFPLSHVPEAFLPFLGQEICVSCNSQV